MDETIKEGITESELYMWRAVFAFSLVDNIFSLEEQKILQSYITTVPLSQSQISILKSDFKKPQDVEALYKRITDHKHKERFCVLARALVWCEGDMDKQEEAILKKVSCLAKNADDNVLFRTRHHPDVEAHHQHYTKAGVTGLFKVPSAVEIRIYSHLH